MNNVIPLEFEGKPVRFNVDGWLHATEIAGRFGKVPNEWLRLSSTKEYLGKLSKKLGKSNTGFSRITLVETRRGNTSHKGTWLHPKLAVKFARWLSVDFEIWCDEQIDRLLHGAPSALQDFHRACRKYNDRKSLASLHGRGLNEWRRDEPALGLDVERGRELLQMTLGLNTPEQPRLQAFP